MIIFLIISSFCTLAVAQQPSISCNYFNFGDYGCNLVINNPDGFNDFTEIEGIHLEGFTNADVTVISRSIGFSTIVPSIICQTFPNLVNIDLNDMGLNEVGATAFTGCTQVTQLALSWNRISSLSENTFANLRDLEIINLDDNLLQTLPENVFANQENVWMLNLNNNPFDVIPGDIFRSLVNLEFLFLANANLNEINSQWFATNSRLSYLDLASNRIAALADNFVGLEGLTSFNLGDNAISEIPAGTFAGIPNLFNLYLFGNNFTELHADSFPDLEFLDYLDLSENPIEVVHGGAFRGLTNLVQLSLSACGLRQLNANSFEGLGRLYFLYMNFNEIEDFPQDTLAPLTSIDSINVWTNGLKTLHRNSFGSLTNLRTLDLAGNIINALDRAIIDDAVNLNILGFTQNLCASNYFGNFLISRAQYLPLLERCFTNMRYVIDVATEADAEYSFFEGINPGIAIRVFSDNEVQISLTPFNFIWSPTIEVFIGAANNTRSLIRIDAETDVVTVPTPNIIRSDQRNDFRVSWANQVILVYSGSSAFPFMAYTMRDFFPVNFYGLRAVQTSATWVVQPFDW